ncbi:MAG: hypothetical protein V4649_07140 [Bacteroidota bacterium]
MKKQLTYIGVIAVAVFTLLSGACKKKQVKDPYTSLEGNYFSVRQFVLDEWNTFSGEPFVLVKTIKIGDKTDSCYTNSDTLDWSRLFKVFFATEISDRKYLGKYNFTQFEDNDDFTHNFFYEAKEDVDDLFTRKLLITIDAYSKMVKGIYIETEKKTLLSTTIQKLYYRPMKTIQIQTTEKALFGDKKHTVEQYDFQR